MYAKRERENVQKVEGEKQIITYTSTHSHTLELIYVSTYFAVHVFFSFVLLPFGSPFHSLNDDAVAVHAGAEWPFRTFGQKKGYYNCFIINYYIE